MTSLEFSNEFDILYNSISSNAAPGIDLYEKSVYLTKAQEEIVKNYYDPMSNRKQKGFENSEKRRHDLKALIKNHKNQNGFINENGISNKSIFFTIPDDIFVIIQEQVLLKTKDKCTNNTYLKVVPKTHDEYNIQIKNPFKKPTTDSVWRMDFSNIDDNHVVELISLKYNRSEITYLMRYLKVPRPIILGNLNDLFPNDDLSINGISVETECELHPFTQKEILDRAVELALRDYKAQNLDAKIQTNLRNE